MHMLRFVHPLTMMQFQMNMMQDDCVMKPIRMQLCSSIIQDMRQKSKRSLSREANTDVTKTAIHRLAAGGWHRPPPPC